MKTKPYGPVQEEIEINAVEVRSDTEIIADVIDECGMIHRQVVIRIDLIELAAKVDDYCESTDNDSKQARN